MTSPTKTSTARKSSVTKTSSAKTSPTKTPPANTPPAEKSAAERLEALRQKLEEAREANVRAVEEEHNRNQETSAVENGLIADDDTLASVKKAQKRRRGRKRQRAVVNFGSADEADGEDEDDRLRSMKRRARQSHLKRQEETEATVGEVPAAETEETELVVSYGTAKDKPENVDRMVAELEHVEKRRAKFRRRRAFDEDRAHVTFINEGNRLFNKELDKHFDKFESVREIKENLEKGTA